MKAESDCNFGYSIGGHLPSNLSYADDIAAIARSAKELQQFIDCVVKHSADVGLFVNVSKTECMMTDKNSPSLNITIYGKPIKKFRNLSTLDTNYHLLTMELQQSNTESDLGWQPLKRIKTF